MGSAARRQLEAALQRHGWRVTDRGDKDLGWWADEVWVVESEWSPRGARAYLTFLVDPQWDSPRQRGAGVWAVSASSTVPSSRAEAETRLIPLKRWDEELPAFVEALNDLRRVS